MIGGFRRNTKRGNIRKKIATVGSDDEDGEDSANSPTVEAPVVLPVTPAKTSKIKKSSSALSFGDELKKEDEFVIKRSKASMNMVEEVKKEKRKKKKGIASEQCESQDNDNITVETKQAKKAEKKKATKNNGLQIKTFDENEIDDDSNVSHRFSLGSSKLGALGDIPDAATIYAMKKKREQARQFSGQVAYIPLNTNKYEGRYTNTTSRLVREEMDESSDEDRMEMKGSGSIVHPELERRKQVAKALEEVHDESDEDEKENDDEELQRWEDEQIKKGSQMPTNQAESYGPKLPETNGNLAMITEQMYTGIAQGYTYPPMLPAGYAPQMYSSLYSVPTTDEQVLSVDYITKTLGEQLDTKKQLFAIHQQQRDKISFDLDSSKNNIVTLERKAADNSDSFMFYQDIRGFVKDLIECLNEKVKKINNLEQSMHETFKKRAEKLVTRRQNDVKDEVDEIGGKNKNESERITNAKNRRIAEREGRRTRRREGRRYIEAAHNEGMSSDDEMIPSESLRFQADRGKILKEAESIFEDVINDFASIREILSHFEQWKLGFSDSYKEAYLGLCLPKLFTPFIKLQLLNWNPLELEVNTDFEEMNWFHSLALYADYGEELKHDDKDLKILPNIIEKVLIPKLTVLMRDVWDPLSSKQTRLVTFLFQRLVDDYPTITKESKETKALVETIVLKLKTAVESELYIPLYPRTLLETKNSHSLAFLERQFWRSVKLLGNVMAWNWLLSQKKLQELGIDAILNRYLIIALQQFPDPILTLEKAKTVVNVLPKEWFEKSDDIVPGLKTFARYLSGLASAVYKSSLGYTEEYEKKKAKITVKKIISLLMHIQAFDDARTVATNFKEEVRKDYPKESPMSSPTPSPVL